MNYVRIPARRFQQWINVLGEVEKYSHLLKEKLGKTTVILHGSYARGDYNLWSDVDLIVISKAFQGVGPLDRYDLLPRQPPLIEPILLTPAEFIDKLEKHSWIKMLMRGIIIIIDDYSIRETLVNTGIKADTLREALQHIRTLKAKYTNIKDWSTKGT